MATGHPSEDRGGWYDGAWGWERYIAERARYAMDGAATRPVNTDGMFAGDSRDRFAPGEFFFESRFESERRGWKSEGSLHVRASGGWEFFPEKVRYERYGLDNQPNNPEWTAFIQDTIAGYEPPYWQEITLANAPIVITDAWHFTWGGIEMALVNASNMIERGRTADIDRGAFAPNPPPARDTIVYHVSALFIEGREPHVFIESVWPGPIHQPMDEAPALYGSWLPNEPADEWFWEYVQWFDAVQYGEDGNWMVCPMFYVGGHDLVPPYVSMLLIDLDGCGEPELVIHTPGNPRGLIQIFKHSGGQLEAVYQNFSPW
jgi:hypothetical protein